MVLGGADSPWVCVLSPPCRCPPSKASHPKHLQEPSWSSPITPGLQAPLHLPAAMSAQPGPSSLPADAHQPLPLLPTPCPPPAATAKPQSPEKPRNLWKKQVPNPTLPPAPRWVPVRLPAAPAGTVPTAGTCSLTHCSPPAPRSHPDAEGMDVHIPGRGVHSPPRNCTLFVAATCSLFRPPLRIWMGSISGIQPVTKSSPISAS